MSLRTVGVKLTAEISSYVSGMRRATESTKSFGQSLSQSASTGKLDKIADRAGVMGVALGGAAAYAVKQFMDFDKQMSAVSAATNASASDMEALRKAAMQAGADTKYSATEAAKGIEELAKAGVSTKDILGGGLSGALSLAAAGEMDVGAAAETAASAMTQFKLKGADLPHVADLLAAGAGKAQGSVQDMGQALNQAGLIASSTGLSIEETTGTLAAFASAGLTGSDAGTSFKTMLQAIQAPSGKTKELMDELGVSAYDAGGNFVGIAKFADNLRGAMFKLTPEVRANAMAQIFGSDATRAANVLYEQGAAGITDWMGKVNDSGYAAETAAKKTDNLRGDLERLQGSFDTLIIGAGSGSNGGLRAVVQMLEKFVDALGRIPSGVSGTALIIGGLTGAALLAFAAFVKTTRAIANTRTELEKLGPAGTKASVALGKVTAAAGVVGGALLALLIVGTIADQFGKASVNTDLLTGSLEEFNKTGAVSGELAKAFGPNLEMLGTELGMAERATHGFDKALNGLNNSIPGLAGLTDTLMEKISGTSWNAATEDVKALDASMAQFVGTTKDTEAANRLWMQVLAKSGLNADELAKQLPNTSAALAKMQVESMNAKNAQAGLGANIETVTSATEGEKDALDELFKTMKAQVDPVFGFMDAQNKMTAANKKASEAISKYGRDSDEARVATQEVALAAIDLTSRATSLGKTFGGKLSPELLATMRAAGVTEDSIKILGKEFVTTRDKAKTFAKKWEAKASLTGAAAVNKEIDTLLIKQRALQSGLSYSAAKGAVQRDMDATRRGVYGHAATGGHIVGPGTGTSDSIPTMLSNGEFVIKAESAKKIGYDKLHDLNRFADAPGYATGGVVGLKFPIDVKKTKILSLAEALAIVQPNIPSGGMTYKWIEQMAKAIVPGIKAISTYRPGSRALSGNLDFHSTGNAVDFPASLDLARGWNARFGKYTDELISPWQQYNLWNGKRHQYTGAVWNQHNFAGGNAHDHIAVTGRLGGGGGVGGSSPTGNLATWITRALSIMNLPSSWRSPLNTLIMRESGGNPNAQNNWDSNAAAGNASRGLMQTIPSTFQAYRMPSLPNNIFDPVSNIVAGIRYIQARYGSIFNVQQANANMPAKGYANGGLITEPISGVGASGRRYTFGEYGPETVIPGTKNWMAGGGGSTTITTTFEINVAVPATANQAEVGRAVVGAIQAYERGSGKKWRS